MYIRGLRAMSRHTWTKDALIHHVSSAEGASAGLVRSVTSVCRSDVFVSNTLVRSAASCSNGPDGPSASDLQQTWHLLD